MFVSAYLRHVLPTTRRTVMRETAHHKRPEQRKRVRRVFRDRRATRCGEPDRRGGPGRRRDDEESISVWEVASTSEPLPGDRRLGLRRAAGVKVLAYDGVEMKKCRLLDLNASQITAVPRCGGRQAHRRNRQSRPAPSDATPCPTSRHLYEPITHGSTLIRRPKNRRPLRANPPLR